MRTKSEVKLFNLWLTPTERAILERVREKMGLRSAAEVIRALLFRAEKDG